MKLLQPKSTARCFTVDEVRQRARAEMQRTGLTAEELLRRQTSSVGYPDGVLHRLWSEINNACFDGELDVPLMILAESDINHLVDNWDSRIGDIEGYCDIDIDTGRIVILVRTDLTPKRLMEVMAHEMVHQHLAETVGYGAMCKIGHGPEFYAYEAAVKRYYGLRLIKPGE